MIFIILFLHCLATLHADALPTPTANVSVLAGFVNISPSCRDIASCRELSSIIRSCLTTIFACIWFAQHPDVPPPSSNWLQKLGSAAITTFYNLLVPDLMLVKAIQQFISAGAVAEKLNDIRDKIEQEEKAAQAGEGDADSDERYGDKEEGYGDSEEGDTAMLDFARQRHDRMNPQASLEEPRKYTRKDGFFVVMRGLHFYDSDNTPIRPLTTKDVTDLAERGIFLIPRPDDIDDRSKASWITKGLAIIQTASFATQCVARLALHMPTTELELTALAYTTITVLAYFIWWKKPVSIGSPVRVVLECPTGFGKYRSNGGTTFNIFGWKGLVDGWRPLLFTTQRPGVEIGVRLLLITATVALTSAFGAIHCINWWTSSTHWHDQDTWFNYSAIAITFLPVGMGVCSTLGALTSIGNSQDYIVVRALQWLLIVAFILQMGIYRLFRSTLFFLALEAFNNPQDPAVYEVPDWSTYMPNI
ncbi:hypothetical protein FIBSPDRAFT_1036042 [Athelia psychrophila]|uniref:Uncharacterized protein n=1 Tax=Athelia psychrophila TaxID=1759441 RepID=A0A166W8I2_9AGAM|nr:hypothetical protein FIBSPDRAFT_1036042 [Fibularhizoctonia sp. CBS 109695]